VQSGSRPKSLNFCDGIIMQSEVDVFWGYSLDVSQ